MTHDFDLRRFREERLKMTQAELARHLGIRQDQVSRLEQEPGAMSVDIVMRLCELSGMTPNQVLDFRLSDPEPLHMNDSFRDVRVRRAFVEEYLEAGRKDLQARLEEGGDDELSKGGLQHVQQLMDVVHAYTSKPLVAFLGRSDAGKSRMINALTGANVLPAEWQPTTSIRVYVKHVKDKPCWMDEQVWVFRRPEPGQAGWDYRRFRSEEYCRRWKLDAGSSEILKLLGTRDGGGALAHEAEAAVVYVDSPLLLVCDIVDLPGFGTGDREEDDIAAQKGREQADVVVYLSLANSFMHKDDILFLKQLLRELGPVELYGESDLEPLSNLFIVASQAHIPREEEVPGIVETGAYRLASQIPEDVWEAKTRLAKEAGRDVEYSGAALRKRFFHYTLDNAALRKDFEAAFRRMLETQLPPLWEKRVVEALNEAKDAAVRYADGRVLELTAVLEQREEQKAVYEELRRQEPAFRARLEQQRKLVTEKIERAQTTTLSEFQDWYAREITPTTIEDIIRRRNYRRKEAEQFLAGNVNDIIYGYVEKRLEVASKSLQKDVERYIKTFEDGVKLATSVKLPSAKVPFDVRGAFLGGLSSASVLGGLALWAGTMGNLGGYILVAKGVSLLSALGISISGGTAAAASAVAALGGPVTLAVGLAVGIGAAVMGIFGERWQIRMARRLYKQMEREGVLGKYENVIVTFWKNTGKAFRQGADQVEAAWDAELERLERLLSEEDPQIIRDMLAQARGLRDFFGGVSWGGGATT